MQNPTRRKHQGMIQEIIKQKIEDGQLDESELTQGDLHKIQESFDTSLLGMVGHRIAYPERQAGKSGTGLRKSCPRRPASTTREAPARLRRTGSTTPSPTSDDPRSRRGRRHRAGG